MFVPCDSNVYPCIPLLPVYTEYIRNMYPLYAHIVYTYSTFWLSIIDTCRDYIVSNPIVGWIAIPHIYVGVQDHLTFDLIVKSP